ncbi:Gamma-aminobutyric acid receptor subunit rho-2 [Liparis tanakae]|uniref:Gamma-aminobutyric acid receptor subunit rho-2 n=1 Tax=Liparis tanakae TaxID=230148 RepID=A0A4Z2ETJ4_9TELE|nr:Gamma-aminobutyric acid receptor subunit rho-2 [Liparis tanakae]
MPDVGRPLLLLLLCLVLTGRCRQHGHRVRRWTGTAETQKHGTGIRFDAEFRGTCSIRGSGISSSGFLLQPMTKIVPSFIRKVTRVLSSSMRPSDPIGILRGELLSNAALLPSSSLVKKPPDVTKARKTKTENLLKVEDHDFTMRPAFAGGWAALCRTLTPLTSSGVAKRSGKCFNHISIRRDGSLEFNNHSFTFAY